MKKLYVIAIFSTIAIFISIVIEYLRLRDFNLCFILFSLWLLFWYLLIHLQKIIKLVNDYNQVTKDYTKVMKELVETTKSSSDLWSSFNKDLFTIKNELRKKNILSDGLFTDD